MSKLFKAIRRRLTTKVVCHEVERTAKIIVIGPRDVERAAVVATVLKQTDVGRDIFKHLQTGVRGNLYVELVNSEADCPRFLNQAIASGEIFILLGDVDVPASNVTVQQIEAIIREVKGDNPYMIYTASAESTEMVNFNFPMMTGVDISISKTWRTITMYASSPDFAIIQSFVKDINSHLESRVRLLSD